MRKIATIFTFVFVMAAAPLAFAEPPSNDSVAQAEEVTLPFADVTDTSEATTEVGEPITDCDPRPTQNTIWYSFTPTESGRVFFDTLGSDFDTIVAIYTKRGMPHPLDVTGHQGLALFDCQDPDIEDEFSLWLGEGVTYLFQVGGHIDHPGGVVHFNAYEGASIAGRVTDESDAPLGGVCVTAEQRSEWGYPDYGWLDWYGSAVTDSNGDYKVEDLPAGDFIVSFWDCNWSDSREFLPEFYNDKTSPSDADQIPLAAGESATGIDAGLKEYIPPTPPPPMYTDLAVSGVEVTNVPIETDYGHVGYSGYMRDITAEFGNISTQTSWATLRISACTDDGCSLIHSSFLNLDGGASRTEKFRWDASGYVGDVTIRAEISPSQCNTYDSDTSNNEQRADHYVIVGGTGVSMTTPLAPSYYYYDEYHYGEHCAIFQPIGGDAPPA